MTERHSTVDSKYHAWLERQRRQHVSAFARRSLAVHARCLVPFLLQGMKVLDVGCGPGSITCDIAHSVKPGIVTGVDTNDEMVELSRQLATERNLDNVVFQIGDAHKLPFDDAEFDAILIHFLLQHVKDPGVVLSECRRVVKQGGVIVVADTDLSATIIHPDGPWLAAFHQYVVRLRELRETSPTVGRRLRSLLDRAGFESSLADVVPYFDGDTKSVNRWTDGMVQSLRAPEAIAYAGRHDLASASELEAMADAWEQWGRESGAIYLRLHFQAVGKPI
jgi:ubiquinone/menaquinone biosynthesis C-methylase UbiE